MERTRTEGMEQPISVEELIGSVTLKVARWAAGLIYENTPPDVIVFAEHNVEIVGDPELEKLTARSWPGAAEIITKDGRKYYKRFNAHKGEISNPLTKEELQAKFRRMTPMLGSRDADSVIRMVDGLEGLDDLGALTASLRPSP